MPRKKTSPERIISLLRQIEVQISTQGLPEFLCWVKRF